MNPKTIRYLTDQIHRLESELKQNIHDLEDLNTKHLLKVTNLKEEIETLEILIEDIKTNVIR